MKIEGPKAVKKLEGSQRLKVAIMKQTSAFNWSFVIKNLWFIASFCVMRFVFKLN